ncbi:hypothetical protein Cni_G10160 [Canna indica]|uniref:Uncharacterized protein n=1 Tax=Canna indica TaxID=4628 RepID=A0AAQ3K5B2_9LILI|nr:hypothetical protein Cni_G10160 [Canna indica]
MAKFQEKAASFMKMEELREANKTNWQNLNAIVEDKKSRKGDGKSEDRNRHEQNNDRGPRKREVGAEAATLGDEAERPQIPTRAIGKAAELTAQEINLKASSNTSSVDLRGTESRAPLGKDLFRQ